ncbi:MAG TPA: adenylate/guanylate cyclase domain-containing protein [Burkholderiales bacterium]|nr:adenylate/guanylate cyclase domain-containing protein [Burkholderiales bacterium]
MMKHAPFLVLAVCGVLLAASGAACVVDLKLLDGQFRLLRAWFPQPTTREVVVVGIDEETTKLFPEPITLWHRHLGRFLSAMALAKPAVVGFDIVLPDRSYEQVLPGSDRELMKGMLEARRSFPLVVGLTLDPTNKRRAIHAPFLTLSAGAGYVLFPLDRDGIVRRFDERLGERSEAVPTLVGEMARHLKVEPRAGLIDFRQGARFAYVPLQQILRWLDEGNGPALERAFGGKPVAVGMVFQYEDRLPGPVQLAAWNVDASNTPGVLLHAQALRNLLNGGLIRPVSAAAIAVLSAAAALLWFISASSAVIAAAVIALCATLFGVSTWLLAQGWFVPMFAPALTGTLALGGRNGYDTLLKLRERRRLRASFSGYVSPAVMDEILAGHLRPELGGTRKFVCVMFSDIRGYTMRSERMAPEQIIRFLNRYFDRVVALIHERGGSVMCFMGDGIMAVFGAPKPLDNPCREAFEAARAMLAFVAELNRELVAEGEPSLDIGIGLNAGEAVVGHVGSSSRHDYSAIGDVTNVASRLEGLTKETGYHVVLSKVVAERLGRLADLAPLGPMALKGHTPVEAFGYDKVAA